MLSRSISAAEAYERIPHDGAMRLLGGAVSWNATSIRCSATSHTDPANPLRDNGVLSAVHALEYAAQAVALHASLQQDDRGPANPKLVYVANFRAVEMHPGALDEGESGLLDIQARRVAILPNGWNYEFSVTSEALVLARGKMVVVVPEAAA
jgi:predicted hotdog family 3-hydroxylacyl-ACP dehydratase